MVSFKQDPVSGPNSAYHGLAGQLRRFSKHCARTSRQWAKATAAGGIKSVAGTSLGVVGVVGAVQGIAAAGGLPLDDGQGSRAQGSRKQSVRDFGHPARRLTDCLLVLSVVCFGAQWLSKDVLTLLGAKINESIFAGQYWRLLTPAFLHAGLLHLAVNCQSLHVVGPPVEMASGGPRFLAIYVISALTCTAVSVMGNPAPSLGASGAIMGLGAALGVFYWRNRGVFGDTSDAVLRSLGLSLLINAAFSILNRRMDNWGHLGGLMGGAVSAWLLGPRLVPSPSGNGQLVDRPLIPLLAHKGVLGVAKRVVVLPPGQQQQPPHQQESSKAVGKDAGSKGWWRGRSKAAHTHPSQGAA